MKTLVRPVIVSLCIVASSASLAGAQTRAHYRTYQMGDDLLTVSRGVPSAPVTLAPGRPGSVQDLTWRAQYVRRGVARSDDSVAQLVFSFYEDQLFRIVIDYAPDRTEGMTEADMVAAVSEVYGPPTRRTRPTGQTGVQPQRLEDTVIAEWATSAHHVSLLTVSGLTVNGQAGFRMIVASVPLEALARAAGARDAPADSQDRASTEAGRRHADAEKAAPARETTRRANIASFIL
jgi:hypothetical protein